MKLISFIAIAFFFLITTACEPSQTEERIPSHKVSPEADVTTTSTPDDVPDRTAEPDSLTSIDQ